MTNAYPNENRTKLYLKTYPGAYCIKHLPEKNSGYFNQSIFSYGKVNGKNHANLSFQILAEFFSGKSFMQWAPLDHDLLNKILETSF